MNKDTESANLKGSKTLKKFHMGRIECLISSVDSFGTEPHYGFTWRDDSGGFHSGWMPCSFVENYTGHGGI